MSSIADSDTPRQIVAVSSLESKFSQLAVSLEDSTQAQAEPLPVYTPIAQQMPKASAQNRGRSPGPRSLASRGIMRHRTTKSAKSKSAHPVALAAQLKKRLVSQRQHGDEMEVDSGRGRNVRKNSVRAGVLVARKKRGSLGLEGAEDADVSSAEIPGPSRNGATPYERNNSALVYWSRRRASSFGEQPTWELTEASTSAVSTSDETSTSTLPTTRRKRSGRSASTSGLPLPHLDTTDGTVRRPSIALTLLMTPLIQDVDMASPMAPTPIMRTTTESSMWAPRKLSLTVTHGPIDEELHSAIDTKSAFPSSPPPTYDSVIQLDDSDGDADDEKTPLRTAPIPSLALTKHEGSPAPSGSSKSTTTSLATVQEEEEEPAPVTPKSGVKAEGEAEEKPESPVVDQDAMIL